MPISQSTLLAVHRELIAACRAVYETLEVVGALRRPKETQKSVDLSPTQVTLLLDELAACQTLARDAIVSDPDFPDDTPLPNWLQSDVMLR